MSYIQEQYYDPHGTSQELAALPPLRGWIWLITRRTHSVLLR